MKELFLRAVPTSYGEVQGGRGTESDTTTGVRG